MLYIDGCHDYEIVVSDIKNYCPMVKKDGFIIIDDSANYLDMPKGVIRMDWFGLEDVSNAVRDTIEQDENYKHLFACGHNRIWQKLSDDFKI